MALRRAVLLLVAVVDAVLLIVLWPRLRSPKSRVDDRIGLIPAWDEQQYNHLLHQPSKPNSTAESPMSGVRTAFLLLALVTAGCTKQPSFGPVAPQDTAQAQPDPPNRPPGELPT